MSITIRPATAADYDDVRRVTREAYLHGGHAAEGGAYLALLENVEHRASHALIWVAEVDGQVAGTVALARPGGKYADIALDGELEFRMLAVDPTVQRGGVGRALVEAIVSYARSLDGVQAVCLTSGEDMTRAHRLYESIGFRRVPERDWTVPGTDIPLLVFRLQL